MHVRIYTLCSFLHTLLHARTARESYTYMLSCGCPTTRIAMLCRRSPDPWDYIHLNIEVAMFDQFLSLRPMSQSPYLHSFQLFSIDIIVDENWPYHVLFGDFVSICRDIQPQFNNSSVRAFLANTDIEPSQFAGRTYCGIMPWRSISKEKEISYTLYSIPAREHMGTYEILCGIFMFLWGCWICNVCCLFRKASAR